MSQEALLIELKKATISLNSFAQELLDSSEFTIRETRENILLVQTTVAELGLQKGGNLEEVFEAAYEYDLSLCELDIAPFLRLHLLEQDNSYGLQSAHKAPPSSITVASQPLYDSIDFPKGFYLRKVDNILWLRGYRCDAEHVFDPTDSFIFMSEKKR